MRNIMPDNKSKQGARDRSRVAGNEGYEVNYFATKHGITRAQARADWPDRGNDQAKLTGRVRSCK